MDGFFLILIFLAVALSVVAGYFVLADLGRRDERLATRRVEKFRKDGESSATIAPLLYKEDSAFDLGEFARPASSESAPSVLFFLLRRTGFAPCAIR